jgi:hypothetical protein
LANDSLPAERKETTVMQRMKTLGMVCVLGLAAAACGKDSSESPAESASEGAEDVGDKVQESVEDTGDKVEEATE